MNHISDMLVIFHCQRKLFCFELIRKQVEISISDTCTSLYLKTDLNYIGNNILEVL